MSLDLLRERFGYSVKKQADNKEKAKYIGIDNR